MFGRATITLGIGPHSSLLCVLGICNVVHIYSVVGAMELSQFFSVGLFHLLLTACVACGSAVINSGINLYF